LFWYKEEMGFALFRPIRAWNWGASTLDFHNGRSVFGKAEFHNLFGLRSGLAWQFWLRAYKNRRRGSWTPFRVFADR
jgi:hypothetical protein